MGHDIEVVFIMTLVQAAYRVDLGSPSISAPTIAEMLQFLGWIIIEVESKKVANKK